MRLVPSAVRCMQVCSTLLQSPDGTACAALIWQWIGALAARTASMGRISVLPLQAQQQHAAPDGASTTAATTTWHIPGAGADVECWAGLAFLQVREWHGTHIGPYVSAAMLRPHGAFRKPKLLAKAGAAVNACWVRASGTLVACVHACGASRRCYPTHGEGSGHVLHDAGGGDTVAST